MRRISSRHKIRRLVVALALPLLLTGGISCINQSLDDEDDGADAVDEGDVVDRDGSTSPDGREGPPDSDGYDFGDTATADDAGDTYNPSGDSGGGGDAGEDASMQQDTVSGCGGRQCGTNAQCNSGTCECKSGYTGDPYSKCTKKMQGNCSSRGDCGQFAVCISGNCKCEPGFIPKSGSKGCNRPSVGNPKNRTKSQVCQRWSKVQSGLTRNLWAQSPQNTCDPGVLKPKVHWEAMRATNGYRWLIGLDPVASDKSTMAMNQECATMMAANGQLSHSPPMSWQCYTQKGAQGAGSSNLAAGARHPASTVSQYIRDRGNRSTMGHRRWIFRPAMGTTGFGHRGSYGCMHTFDGSGPDNQNVVRYPSRGPFPMNAIRGPWNYFETGTSSFGSAKVTVTDVKSGNQISVSSVSSPQGSYGRIYGVVWEVSGVQAGHTYRVKVSNYGRSGSKSTSYKTTLVNCP